MKKIALFVFFIVVLSFVSLAQKPYSAENLEKATQEELDVFHSKAIKLQKTGRTFNIIGGASLGSAVTLGIIGGLNDSVSWTLLGMMGALTLIGGTSLAVGIPMSITGKNRVERIDALRNSTYHGVTFELEPCAQYNLYSGNYQPGVTLRIQF